MIGESATSRYIILIRISLISFGCLGVWWGYVNIPIFWQQSSIERIADHIIAGESFRAEILATQIPIVEQTENSIVCRPSALRSATIIRLRLLEENISRDGPQSVNGQMNSLNNSIRRYLSCSPADPFFWLILFWEESVQNGHKPSYSKYLRLSYRVGPNEGWIGLKRNPVAFSVFEKLPIDVAENTMREVFGLLDSEFYDEVAEIVSSQNLQVRDLIFQHLKSSKEIHRIELAKRLYNLGYDINLQEIKRSEQRREP
jgi:hypothetical protein